MRKARWLLPVCTLVAIGAIAPSYVRAYRVGGYSDAPSFLVRDLILVSKVAYDIRLPYTDIVIVSHAEPRRGDVVTFRPPGEDVTVFKRVIGCPGDTVVVQGGRLEIGGVPLRYTRVEAAGYEPGAARNHLGELIEMEMGNGPPHLITHTPDTLSAVPSAAARVAEDHYYLVGDNRDHSLDSRTYGAVHRASITGRVVRTVRSTR